jgi:hypothetical protein
MFGGLRAPSPFPPFRTTMAQAAQAVAGFPVLVAFPLVAVLLMWLGLLAMGLDHVPGAMYELMAIPPISSFFDLNVVVEVTRLSTATLPLIIAVSLVRALLWAIVVGLAVQSLEGGPASLYAVLRALRAYPAVLVIILVNTGVVYLAQILLALGSLGQLLFLLVFAGGLYLLPFAAAAAIRSGVPAREAMRRSAVAARFPGSRHVGLVLLYFFIVFIPLQYSLKAPGPYTANPSILQWVIVLGVTLLHVLFVTAFAYRYISVEHEIPPPRPRAPRPAGRRR